MAPIAVAAALGMSAEAAFANPFVTLAGSWRGSGKVSPVGGVMERVNCRVGYQVSGSSVTQTINCAGTDYRISAVGNMTYSGGRITGFWRESNYGVGGSIRGTAKGGGAYIRISSDAFNGRMVIKVGGRSSHSVTITQFDPGSGRYIPLASMTLRR
jgi:hypothetical protein